MLSFVEKFQENVNKSPNMTFIYDEYNTKGISYSKIDEVSAKIYAYLSNIGVGKEDFVLINLPRGVQPVLAMVGVWKAGAAFTIVEDNYAPDRIEFIRKDCNCKAEINKDSNEKTEVQITEQGAFDFSKVITDDNTFEKISNHNVDLQIKLIHLVTLF